MPDHPRPLWWPACLVAFAFSIAGPSVRAATDPALTATPLAPPSAPRGATLFTTLDPATTGLTAPNLYADPRMWARRYREFTLGAIGTGLASGDFDGDGRVDLYVVRKTEPDRLFRNLGDWRFEDVTVRAGLELPASTPPTTPAPTEWKQGVAFADLDGDGDLDLYVCRFAAPNLLFWNQGDGTLREGAAAAGLALTDASSMTAIADYDRDGWLDLYVQTNVLDSEARPSGQRDRLFHNNRDGTFTDVTDRAGLSGETQGHSATWWDFNHDGWPDLHVANDFREPDQLYRNNGDGTFTNALSYVLPHTTHSSMGADLGDVDNDGLLDLFVADMATTTRAKDHRGMAGLREGLTDDVARPHAAPQLMRNALFLGTELGVAREAAALAGLTATDWTWSVRLEDLDCDGHLDLHVTNGTVRELHGADIVARMIKAEAFADRIRIMQATPVLAERNLAYRGAGPALHFDDASAAWGLDHDGVSFGAVFADFDGDGDLDLAFSNYQGDVTLCRNDADTGHRLLVALRGAPTAGNRFGVGATVTVESPTLGRQIRPLTLARGYLSTSEPVLHFGLGPDATLTRLIVTWPSGHEQTFTDLAADQHLTITEPVAPPPPLTRPRPLSASLSPPSLNSQPTTLNSSASAASATPLFTPLPNDSNLAITLPERPFNELVAQPLLPRRLQRFGPGAAFADLDGDGQDELCLGGPAGDRARLFSNLGGAQFMAYGASAFGSAAPTADAQPLFLDVDADGDADLLLAKGGVTRPAGSPDYQPRLFLNDGTGRFTAAPADALPTLPTSHSATVAADFDRDGDLDVFLAGRVVPGAWPATPRSTLLVNHGGRFTDATDALASALRTPGLVTAALWSDVDDDGWPDLLLALEWGTIRCFRNDQSRGFTDVSDTLGFASAGTGWWSSLTAADFNGDGRPDFVAGNTGLNTPYSATPAHPTLLYVLPPDAPGRAGPPQPAESLPAFSILPLPSSTPLTGHLIEAHYEDDTLYPRRSRDTLATVFPALRTRFPTHAAYSTAALDEVFPPDRLAAATRFAATELASGVFLSQPDGTWRFAPLPRLAQLAPIHGLAAGDFDGDGHADLITVGNTHAPIPSVGRFAGGIGLMLRGDGRGGLAPVSVGESGFVVTGDARALAVTDFDGDGWPDVFVTRSQLAAVALRNTTPARAPDRRSFAVALRGPVGNPTGVGAAITVVATSGATQRAEIHAGSGYLSQSTAAAFFGYTIADLPREVRVRWPDGRTSTHAWQAAPRLTCAAP